PYRKIIQKSNENVQTLEEEKKFLFAQLDTSQQKYENLKNFLKEILVSLSKDNQEELVNELNSEIENRKKNAPSFYSTEIKTTELTSKKELVAAKARAEARQGKIQKLSESVAQTPIYKKTIDFLKTKSVFLNARRETIEELQECDAIGNMGGSITDVITFGIPKAVGEVIVAGNNFSKIVIAEKGNKEFQISLSDEKELERLNQIYDSLIELIQENEEVNNLLGLKTRRLRDGKAKLFEKKYEIFDILINDGIVRLGDTVERQEKLVSLRKELLAIAFRHGHKEFETELDSLCQAQIDLTKSQIELEDLQNQQQETQILSPTLPKQINWDN
ncbi:3477_t:CDS:2, partial [Racocetra persica]